MSSKIIPFQLPLPPTVPTIEGNVDYRLLRDQLLLIGRLLETSGLQAQLLQADREQWLKQCPDASPKDQQIHQRHAHRALRCNIARTLLNEGYRGFAAHLADSPLLQNFCGLSTLANPTIPAKSTLQRYALWWPEEQVRQLIQQLVKTGADQPQKLQLEQPLDLALAFLDTTCLATNIHYPVDWVLLRDATKTLMSALSLIRQQKLKHRMKAPEQFVSQMNRLCLEMNHANRKFEKGQRSKRKTIFRKIDQLVGIVANHARRYRAILDQQWEQTQWTRPQAEQVLGRIDHVLKLLPQARKQARQRILQGQPPESKDKLLSLYEPDTRVIVRHKPGAEVEFGNTLLLAESQQGLIVDWQLFKESAPADSRLVVASLARMETAFGEVLKGLGTDRGFDSQANRSALKERAIYDAICPKDPKQLKQRNRSWKFKRLQKRRSQVEPRIAILKNSFIGQPLRSKGFAHRKLSLSWAVLTHNLWVIARLSLAEQKARLKAA